MGLRQVIPEGKSSSFSGSEVFFPQAGTVSRAQNHCFSAQSLDVQWERQAIQALDGSPVRCEICCESAELMCQLLRGSDIGYFSVLYHQLQQYLHFQEPMDEALASLQRLPLTSTNSFCVLRPWQVLQNIICKRLMT
ncbi:hypothetical protein KO507_11345 [Gilvimarinus agarilyticus]|uniref:hypothetical protein n=1 Tax=Gilvimarinus sp. 2_MG-2023 TaxID=3062666 RepID=UPI001C0929A5|nr:hypothetical protein [Gilvimarinus sp. 2_MG-2023]MBU2886360.1 hypothetical protein [Gilvimarinus agarilyticus]MDO6571039.1 hypothetical protein [Gilvimarinus sp. 2_MG-2023]